jgi:hypothetical protein
MAAIPKVLPHKLKKKILFYLASGMNVTSNMKRSRVAVVAAALWEEDHALYIWLFFNPYRS